MPIPMSDMAAPKGENARFDNPGDTCKGVIIDARMLDKEDYFNKGKYQRVMRITIDTDAGPVVLWPVQNNDLQGTGGYPDRMCKAITDAVQRAGAGGVEEGAILAVQFTHREDVPNTTNQAKVYYAEYAPQAGGVDMSQIQAPAQAPQAAPQAPAPAPQAEEAPAAPVKLL